jgi:hypothetical protein
VRVVRGGGTGNEALLAVNLAGRAVDALADGTWEV